MNTNPSTQTLEEFREWAEAKHPSVVEALAKGEAQIVTNERFGFQWFGPEDGICRWSNRTYREWVLAEKGQPFATADRRVEWPTWFVFNGWHFEMDFEGTKIESDPEFMTYRRAS